ncbi:hypothetical protein [Paenibacillus glucanolyticus]|uniref:hypothetical protein n=1 Tax=Paenibacillus glucanolyticus TaxID=59843 RepID=UPI000A573A66|nr:hypothetical protein [Paenibacillus glucanolyticus]
MAISKLENAASQIVQDLSLIQDKSCTDKTKKAAKLATFIGIMLLSIDNKTSLTDCR